MIDIDGVFHGYPPIAPLIQQLEEASENSLIVLFANKKELKQFEKYLLKFLNDHEYFEYDSYFSSRPGNRKHVLKTYDSKILDTKIYHIDSQSRLSKIVKAGKGMNLYFYKKLLIGFFDDYLPNKEMVLFFEDAIELEQFKQMLTGLNYTHTVLGLWGIPYYSRNKENLHVLFLDKGSRVPKDMIYISKEDFSKKLKKMLTLFDLSYRSPRFIELHKLRIYLDGSKTDADNLKFLLTHLYKYHLDSYLIYHGVIAQNYESNFLLYRHIPENNRETIFTEPIYDSFIVKKDNMIQYLYDNYEQIVLDGSTLVTEKFIVYIYDSGIDIYFDDIGHKEQYMKDFIGGNELIDLDSH